MGLSALSLILFGCSEKEFDGPGDGSEVQGYVSLKIEGSAPMSKTAGTSTEDGTGAENQIDKVTVLFVDDAGKVAHIKDGLTLTSGKTGAFKIETGTWKVYVIANPGNISASVGAPVQQVIDVLETEVLGGYNTGKFVMTNERNSSASEAGVPVTISSANTSLNPAPVTVKVDRAAVRVEHDATTPPVITDLQAKHSFITGVTVAGFAPLNVNKQFNLIQEWGKDNIRGTDNPLDYEVLQTPVYAGSPALVKDQFYNNISVYTTLGATEITDISKTITPSPYTTKTYVTENRPTMKFFGGTPVKPTAGRGETTGVIYKVTTTPATTFYVHKSTVYQTVAAIETALGLNPGDLAGHTIPQLRGKGIKVYEDGVMYYTYFIKDPNSAHRYGTDDYYGVFRNSIYKLKINKLTDLGDDVPGGGIIDPKDPDKENPDIDADEAYIDVTVAVNPWVLNEIGIDF